MRSSGVSINITLIIVQHSVVLLQLRNLLLPKYVGLCQKEDNNSFVDNNDVRRIITSETKCRVVIGETITRVPFLSSPPKFYILSFHSIAHNRKASHWRPGWASDKEGLKVAKGLA